MLKILEDPRNSKIITTVAISQLTQNDWENLVSALSKKLQSGNIRWCMELRDFRQEGEETGLKTAFSKPVGTTIERIAIIADREWRGWAKDLLLPFSFAELRYFENDQEAEAHKWLSS